MLSFRLQVSFFSAKFFTAVDRARGSPADAAAMRVLAGS
jgi:hypothetical protein